MVRSSIITAVLAVLIAVGAWAVSTRAPSVAVGEGEVRRRGAVPVSDESVVINVPQGANAGVIARRMQEKGVISDAELFRTLAGLMGLEGKLSAGEYEFTRGMAIPDVILRLRTGVTEPTVTVTIPEGLRVEEVAALFERIGLTTAAEFMQAARATDYPQPWAQSRPAGSTLEGYLFPDTYFFSKKVNAHQIVERLLKTFDERFTPDLRAAAQAHGLSFQDAVTIASIVEREAQVPEERPLVAAVYINRIKAGMPLQADPTVQYALAADPKSVAQYGWWKRDLFIEDLQIRSPYNTYAVRGLPPGPIASPGHASLRAVAHPASVKYIFFVARGDGSHAFAETLDEHNRNVQRYQR